MKFSNTIPSSFCIANETAKKYSESHDFLSVCETVAKHFRDVPWSFDEDQMARGLSLNIYNYLQTRLCLRYDGVTNIEIPQHSLLQGIFPTQGSNPGLPHCRQILYQLSHK